MTTDASKSVREIMEQATGVDSTTEGVAGYSVDDRLPSVVVFSNSIQQLSEIMSAAWDADLAAQLDAETEAIGDIGLTGDFQEGIQAFAEKRQAG